MIAWMLPGVVAASVLGALYVAVRPFRITRRVLPELSVVAAIVLALALGLAPLDGTRLAVWASAAWRPPALALFGLAVGWMAVRSERTGPVPASEALVLGWLLGAVPATALLAGRAHGPYHAARLAVVATAASALSPVGGPAQVLLADRSFVALAAPVAVVVALLAWPWREAPARPGIALRTALPGLLGIPVGWLFGPAAGVVAYVGGALAARPRGPSPEGLAEAFPLRAAVGALAVAALLQVTGIPWGAGWMIDLGDRVPIIPAAVAGSAALPALFVEPFAAAAIADRVVAQPSAPRDLAPLLALPLALSPGPAVFVAAATRGWRTLLLGLPLSLLALGLAVGWVALVG